MKIIVDAMGGDNAPQAPVMGAVQANKEYGVDITLVGRGEEILKVLEDNGIKNLPAGIEIAHASEVVEMCDNPATAFREKKDSSLTVGLNLLKSGAGDAFVSAGSTGALLSGATLVVKRIRGIRRAAMCPQIPVQGGSALLCDCGANAECTSEYLLQFAYLASFYSQRVCGVKQPRVALLNIGAESEKGDSLRRETYERLQEAGKNGRIRFVGNVEPSDAMMGAADVIVADGFSGNIMLKSVEGTAKFLYSQLKTALTDTARHKLGAALVKDGLQSFKKALDPNEVGGTPFLGISKPVIKAHGSSNALAIQNAVRQAMAFASSGFVQAVEENIAYMRVEHEMEKQGEKA